MLAFVVAACGPTPAPSGSPSAAPSPSPTESAPASPVGDEMSVPSQVLPPATEPPAAALCSKPIVITADGNALPLTCSDGNLNVRAWQYYASISASVLGLGLNPTQGQVEAAICDDIKHNHATRPEEDSGYRLARLYYGWAFNIDVTRLTCQ